MGNYMTLKPPDLGKNFGSDRDSVNPQVVV